MTDERAIWRLKRAVAIGGLIALMVAVSGCVTIKSQTTSQRVAGVITLDLTLCASDDDRSDYDDCDSDGTDGTAGNTVEDHALGDVTGTFGDPLGQLLVGYRLPVGTVAPTSFPSTAGEVVFTNSPPYTAALNNKFPPPPGQQWFGFISTPKTFDLELATALQTRLRPEFTLPTEADGSPLAGPFLWRAVAGLRPLDDPTEAGQPFTCGGASCFDSPLAARVGTNLAVAVSDFGVQAGTRVAAGHGETAVVRFPIRYVDGGIKGPQQLKLTATTDLPSSAATPSATQLTVAPGSTSTIDVAVPVPPATPLGTYTVTLAAANGTPAVTRANTATIDVTDKLAPAIRISTPAEGASFRRGQVVAADYACTDETNGTGVGGCAGPVAPGAAIDTSSVGTKAFTVAASDRAGNAAGATASYTVLPKVAPAIKLTFTFARSPSATKFVDLLLKGVPAGSTVTATCRKPRHGCPARAFVKRGVGGRLKLKPFLGKALRPGAVLDVRVTHEGTIGAVKLVKVGAGAAPTISTRCVLPGTTTLRPSC